jgi:HEAT repeat protein
MMQSLDDPSKDVRYATVVVLGQYETEAEFAFQKLVTMLQTDPEATVRAVVVGSLGRIKRDDPILLEPMLGALKDSDKSVYTRALSELCNLGRATKSVVPEVFAFYEVHPDETYRVWTCMREISGENLGNDPAEWHAWWEKNK